MTSGCGFRCGLRHLDRWLRRRGLNDPLLFSLRSALMNLGIAADSLRSYSEQHEDAALRRSTAALIFSVDELKQPMFSLPCACLGTGLP